jgi:hypothetical protein
MPTRHLAFLAVAVLAPLNAGCLFVAAGAAVGAGAAGYYALTHRLYRDYPRDLAQTTAATRTALADLGFPPPKEESKDGSVTLETKAPDGSKVAIEVRTIAGRVPADPPTSRVGIHFGMVGDEDASARILDRLGERLGLPPPQQTQQPLRPVPQLTSATVETAPPPLAR